MSLQKFLIDLDLDNNQILNTSLQNLDTAPSIVGKQPGWIYFNTTTKTAYVYTGQGGGLEWLDLGNLYVHPSTGALTPDLAGNKVLATLIVNAAGHVTGATTRTLTPTDIGAATAAHNHTLANITDVTSTAAELNLLDLAALTTGWVLRATSATTAAWGKLLGSQITNDLNWVKIADGLTNATDTWSSSKIQSLIDDINTSVSGGLINKGGYNASTNVPALDTTPIAGIKNGWTYVVTTGGTFFTEDLQIGDMIIAKQDNPTLLAHWTTVNKNIPDIVQATTSAQGIIQLATPAEVQTGTDANKAVTAAGLSARTSTASRTGILALATEVEAKAGVVTDKAITPATLKAVLDTAVGGFPYVIPGNGTLKTFAVPHNLGTLDVVVQIFEIASGQTVYASVARTTINSLDISFNNAPAASQYRVLVKK